MKMRQLIYLIPLLIALTWGKSVKVQRVVYSEGAIPEGEDDTFSSSSQLEDIPPREQWFRVRGAHHGPHHHHNSQILSQSMSHGQHEIVELDGGRGWTPRRVVVAGAIANQRQASHVKPAIVRQDDDNDQDRMPVHVRSRGKVGFQSRSMRKETESDESEDDDVRADVFTRRIGDHSNDYEEDRGRRPKVVASRPVVKQQTKHLHTHHHHQSGHNNRESTKEEEDTGFQAVSGSSRQQQQPRESEVEEDAVFVVVDRNGRKQGGNVRQDSHQNDRRVEEDDVVDDEMEYEYEDVNDSKSRNRNGKPVQVQAQDGPNSVIKTGKDYDQLNGDSPPPHEQVAKMARYIVHNSNWTSIATISTMQDLKGYPFANVISVSDGPIDESKGTPYMYMTPLDMSAIDLKHDSRASLTMSLAQSDYCRKQEYDPEDPRCAHVILSGRVIQAPLDEKEFAMNALFSRHPEMTDWPKDHGWYFAKLDIEHIVVLDYFGGGKTVKLDDYFNQ